MDWGGDAIERLRALWAEGHSTAEIGRRMGITKNAVVGKAHRLHLPPRPSPIRRDGTSPRPAAMGRQATLPPLRIAPVPAAVPPRHAAPASAPAPARKPLLAVRPAAAPAMPAARPIVRPMSRSAARSCCWPIGEPGTPGFRFCTAEALSPKPYCAEHAALAYVRVRDRREDAA